MIETKPRSSTKGVELDFINTFLSNERKETSFAPPAHESHAGLEQPQVHNPAQ